MPTLMLLAAFVTGGSSHPAGSARKWQASGRGAAWEAALCRWGDWLALRKEHVPATQAMPVSMLGCCRSSHHQHTQHRTREQEGGLPRLRVSLRTQSANWSLEGAGGHPTQNTFQAPPPPRHKEPHKTQTRVWGVGGSRASLRTHQVDLREDVLRAAKQVGEGRRLHAHHAAVGLGALEPAGEGMGAHTSEHRGRYAAPAGGKAQGGGRNAGGKAAEGRTASGGRYA